MAGGVITNEGEAQLLADLLGTDPPENWLLCLIDGPVAQAETDSAAVWIAAEASFSGYARKTILRGVGAGKWGVPTLVAPTNAWSTRTLVAESVYDVDGVGQTWTNAGSVVVVYGFFLLGATSEKLIYAQAYPPGDAIQTGEMLVIYPRFGGS